MGYGKFFSSCFTGSMMGAGPDVFAVWAFVIANAVKCQVELNPRLLAVVLGCPEERVAAAIAFLCAPDPKSRNKEAEGRRLIKEGEYAYKVVSHDLYRQMQDDDQRREYMRSYMREHRQKQVCKQRKHQLSAVAHPEAVAKTQEAEAVEEGEKAPAPTKGTMDDLHRILANLGFATDPKSLREFAGGVKLTGCSSTGEAEEMLRACRATMPDAIYWRQCRDAATLWRNSP